MIINYLIVDGNPGWLAIEPFIGNVFVDKIPKEGIPPSNISLKIAAIDRENHLILAESKLNLEILSNNLNNNIKSQNLKNCFSSPIIKLNIERLENEEEEEEGKEEENKNILKNNLIKFIKIFEEKEIGNETKIDFIEAWDNYARQINLEKVKIILK
ncbi:unnamed protein product [Meloidogyne enterolobii]|uniref:Uncharacterized protein n=1 Tax=Meloidogyne enterolobii TaxID=390850 RepID=A0ACB0Y3L0_MELEN